MARTPGPWAVMPDVDWPQDDLAIVSPDEDGGGTQIATVLGNDEIAVANAALLAASLDLLTAARNALDVARWPLTVSEEKYHEILDSLEAAIAKAEGQD